MPIYDYSCPTCGSIQEDVLHNVSEINNPSLETIKEITCHCSKKGTRRLLAYLQAPSIKTPTSAIFINKSRKERNKNHFNKEILPGLGRDEQIHHLKKAGKKIDVKNMGLVG